MSIVSVMPSNHLILCLSLLLLPSIFPSIRVFSNESALRIRWPKYWSFSFNIALKHLVSLRSILKIAIFCLHHFQIITSAAAAKKIVLDQFSPFKWFIYRCQRHQKNLLENVCSVTWGSGLCPVSLPFIQGGQIPGEIHAGNFLEE